MIKKYSKSSDGILKIKESFLTDNDNLVKESMRWAAILKSQPRRNYCKTCGTSLEGGWTFFTKMGIDYIFCNTCHHINGGYEDTDEFIQHIYNNTQTDYAKNYRVVDKKSYIERVQIIYEPKAEYLIECLKYVGEDPSMLSYCDVGAGSGYFVYALINNCGLKNVVGYEVSREQVILGNEMLGQQRIYLQSMGDPIELLRKCSENVVSMIGVLEHLRNVREVLTSIQNNPNIRYLYLQLPLLSYSVFFELMNPDLYNRHLSVDHTHLYTKDSIDWIRSEYGFETIGEWYFGSDIMDLFRFVYLQLSKDKLRHHAQKIFSAKFLPIMDKLQSVMDRNEFCSDIHILLKKVG